MIDAAKMAVLVNQKLCHDFAQPLNALVTGLDLLRSAGLAERAPDAMSLLEQGVAKHQATLQFFRYALDDSGDASDGGLDDLRETADLLYAQLRPDLRWSAPPMAMPKPALRVIMTLLHIAADAAPRGAVEVDAGPGEVRIIASGPKSKLKPDSAAALRGEPLEGEYNGRSILPGLAGQLARRHGIEIAMRESEDRVEIIVRSPAFRAVSAAA
ncbi:MAG: hypothetical protein HXY28_02890 [Hydrogenophilaceae bacterium]|jgi:histidine phosphotransferase ChpT|nr:hypothetical protein [Hydrogenophilaceae bacterium]